MKRNQKAIVQFGGQTAIKLARTLKSRCQIFGTDAKDVDAAEDREKFDAILEELGIPRPGKNGIHNRTGPKPQTCLDTLCWSDHHMCLVKGMEIAPAMMMSVVYGNY